MTRLRTESTSDKRQVRLQVDIPRQLSKSNLDNQVNDINDTQRSS
jgi:hypothetical protein